MDEKITFGYSFKNAWPDWQYKMDVDAAYTNSGTQLVLPFDAFVYTRSDSATQSVYVNDTQVPSRYFMMFGDNNSMGGQYLSAGTSLYTTGPNARFTIVPLKGG